MEDNLTICDLWVQREKLGEDSEENSSVALLSPAYLLIQMCVTESYKTLSSVMITTPNMQI